MKITKAKMFLVFNGFIAAGLFLYFSIWIFSRTVNGLVVRPFNGNTVSVKYEVDGKTYTDSYMRHGFEYTNRHATIRYLVFDPGSSRMNSFMGIFAEPLAWWLVFFIASAMLLLTNNAVFSKGTIFRLHKKIPWISMEEYFPIPWYEAENAQNVPPPKKQFKKIKRLGNK